MIDKKKAQAIVEKYDNNYTAFAEKASRKEFHMLLKYIADDANRKQRQLAGLEK